MAHTVDLPDIALDYIRSKRSRNAKRMVVLFHRWLERNEHALCDVRVGMLEAFLRGPTGKPIQPRKAYRYELKRYIAWLFEHGYVRVMPEQINRRIHKPLPDLVRSYIAILQQVNRPSTCASYQKILRRFHEWLDREQVPIAKVSRADILRWLRDIHDAGLAPGTRVNMIMAVRRYLASLHEDGLVEVDSYALIRSSDFPRTPDYLPRPVPPEADRKIQARLAASNDPRSLGLLLMRRTGLRIGELRTLRADCVRTDPQGHRFLKVPLGKLGNERLVPLDDKTHRLAESLRKRGRAERQWLLENKRQRPMDAHSFSRVLADVSADLEIPNRMTTHRLRHTYATTLLSGGMSLPGIMKLLGHRDYRMTLRYTDITQETVGRQYFEALAQVEERYVLQREADRAEMEFDPIVALGDCIRWIHKNLCGSASHRRRGRLLQRRLEKILRALEELGAVNKV